MAIVYPDTRPPEGYRWHRFNLSMFSHKDLYDTALENWLERHGYMAGYTWEEDGEKMLFAIREDRQ